MQCYTHMGELKCLQCHAQNTVINQANNYTQSPPNFCSVASYFMDYSSANVDMKALVQIKIL